MLIFTDTINKSDKNVNVMKRYVKINGKIATFEPAVCLSLRARKRLTIS